MYYIGLSDDRNTTINLSNQFQYKKIKKTIKKYEIVRLLNEKVYKIKFIAHINTRLMNSIVEEREFSNDIPFSRNM